MAAIKDTEQLRQVYYERRVRWIRVLINVFRAIGLLLLPVAILFGLGVLNEYTRNHASLWHFSLLLGVIALAVISIGLAQLLAVIVDIDKNSRETRNMVAAISDRMKSSGGASKQENSVL